MTSASGQFKNEAAKPWAGWAIGVGLLCGGFQCHAADMPTVPKHRPYAGQLQLEVDATDVAHRIVRVHETINQPEISNGQLTLAYPKWVPGNHSTTGPVERIAGLHIESNGQTLNWKRDPIETNVFHIFTTSSNAVHIDFDYLSPTSSKIGRIEISDEISTLKWNEFVLYPLEVWARDIPVTLRLKLPQGYDSASALEPIPSPSNDVIAFKTTDLETLLDSPMYAGRYSKTFDLSETTAVNSPVSAGSVTPLVPPVKLHVFADQPSGLDITDKQLTLHRQLIQQASRLYGAHHYTHYDFLLSVSDKVQHIGLEHHQSSEDGTSFDYFINWNKTMSDRDLLAHEYTHSWNGKFRRPADLWTPNYQQPMQNSLLWVYEGQTQYWGQVLTARSGLLTTAQALEGWALTAAFYAQEHGRQWRPLEDTTNDPIIRYRQSRSWGDWQRAEDYYSEGQLIWLEADTIIRRQTHDKASLDDFARRFFGVADGKITPLTYTFDDVIKSLNDVAAYDWANFFKERVYAANAPAPLRGIEAAGYRLIYNDDPNDMIRSDDRDSEHVSYRYSLGMSIDRHGKIKEVLWDSLAFKMGLIEGMEIVAINGLGYSSDKLDSWLKSTTTEPKKLELIVKSDDRYSTVTTTYQGGLRIPHLVRIPDRPDVFSEILKAKQ